MISWEIFVVKESGKISPGGFGSRPAVSAPPRAPPAVIPRGFGPDQHGSGLRGNKGCGRTACGASGASCGVCIRLWPRLPHGGHRLLSFMPMYGAFISQDVF